ncbi:MAG: arsenate reductase ArsC [Bryobacterales bacterium]|nr:arsenate reductase ArsC [Bryobacterales bacterium]
MKQVLFLCVGNSCRSQMAEGFARVYGGDVLKAASAGLAPAMIISPLTHQVMREKGVSTAGHFPKDIKLLDLEKFDLIVNMSGLPFRGTAEKVEDWVVRDPIGANEAVFRQVRDEIEQRVQKLIIQLRKKAKRRS